jgi:putative adenylate-forming enzyme
MDYTSMQMSGLPTILASFALTRYRRFASREALLAWQDVQVRRFVREIRRRSPFYAQLHGDLPAERWRELPIIDKQVMMDHFDTLNTVGVTKEQALAVALASERSRDFSPMIGSSAVGLSSGTSGHRGLFVVSPRERSGWAGALLARLLPSPLRPQRIALFLRANNNLYKALGSRLISFEYFDLLDPLARHLERLEALRPTIVLAPPSLLRMLAEAHAGGRLRHRPAKIVSVAEVLDPVDESFIRARLGGPVHQVYQCTEGFLACSCAYGTLHVNEDIVAVQKEWLDERLGKFVPIITDFQRRAQPIIRYRLNDILTERREPCPCGSPMLALASIEGRCDDMFYLPALSGSGWVNVFPDFIRRAVLEADARIEEYLVRQVAADRVQLTLTMAEAHRDAAEAAVAAALAAMCARVGCRAPLVERAPPEGPRPATRKLKRVERLFTPDAVGA